MFGAVEEHATHNLGEDVFRRSGESGVVEQMASTMFGRGEERVGQPARDGSLVETRLSLQEFHSMQHTAKLVLPPPTCGEELFEYQCAIAHSGFVPTEMTEVAECSQHGGGKYAAVPSPEPAGMAARRVISMPQPKAANASLKVA